MSQSNDRPIRKFNPGTFQSDEEVMAQFVVRKRELATVLEILRGNLESPSCQHVLVVAPRGRGKTMLLARVAAELRTDDEFSGRLVPVRFMEESQEIFDMADFWLETLFHLAREIAASDPEIARQLRETHADLTGRWREGMIEEHARAAVLEAADRLGRGLVLMVENLQSLCDVVDNDFGWKLRRELQSEPQITLLASATSRFKGLDDVEQPFFELFRILGLDPLGAEECRRLWKVASGDAVSRREIRPLEILTGGSPRLLVIVAGFARHRSLGQLMEELVTLIDDHTEYFRGHLEVLAKTERRVYLAVLDLWQPSSTGEIAARARMNVRSVSALLGRLVNRGAVIVEGSARKRLYSAAERLYCIYYKLRRERDEAVVVRNLIHFMAVFYSGAELAELSGMLSMEAERSSAIREGLERALAASDTRELQVQVAKVLFNKGITHGQRGESEAALAAYDDLVVARFGASDTLEIHGRVAVALLNKGIMHGQRDEPEAALAAYDNLVARFGGSEGPELHGPVAVALLNKGIMHDQRDEPEAARAACDDLIARFGGSERPELQIPVAMALALKGITHGQRDESEAALAVCDDLLACFGGSERPELQIPVAMALLNKGVMHGQRDESEAALAACDDLVARFGGSERPELQVQVAMALLNKGDVHGQRDESGAALAACDDLVADFGGSKRPELQVPVAMALLKKGVMHGQRGEYEAAPAAYDDLVARFGGSKRPELQVSVAKALFNKGVMHYQRGEYEAALAAYDDVLARFGGSERPELQVPVAKALLNKSITHGQRGESEAELAICDDLLARFGDSKRPEFQVLVAMAMFSKGIMHDRRDETGAVLAACDDLLARFGGSKRPELQVPVAEALLNKGIMHYQRGESEAELAAYDDLVARFGGSERPEIQVKVAKALHFRGNRQIAIGRAEEALRTSDELDRRFGATTDSESIVGTYWLWQAKWIRVHALLVQKEYPAALSAFQSVCAMFVVGSETMLREMLVQVPILIIHGASERDLARILSADSRNADALAPLVVALRRLAGESVRASAEVLEVAADIHTHIEAAIRRGGGLGARRVGG